MTYNNSYAEDWWNTTFGPPEGGQGGNQGGFEDWINQMDPTDQQTSWWAQGSSEPGVSNVNQPSSLANTYSWAQGITAEQRQNQLDAEYENFWSGMDSIKNTWKGFQTNLQNTLDTQRAEWDKAYAQKMGAADEGMSEMMGSIGELYGSIEDVAATGEASANRFDEYEKKLLERADEARDKFEATRQEHMEFAMDTMENSKKEWEDWADKSVSAWEDAVGFAKEAAKNFKDNSANEIADKIYATQMKADAEKVALEGSGLPPAVLAEMRRKIDGRANAETHRGYTEARGKYNIMQMQADMQVAQLMSGFGTTIKSLGDTHAQFSLGLGQFANQAFGQIEQFMLGAEDKIGGYMTQAMGAAERSAMIRMSTQDKIVGILGDVTSRITDAHKWYTSTVGAAAESKAAHLQELANLEYAGNLVMTEGGIELGKMTMASPTNFIAMSDMIEQWLSTLGNFYATTRTDPYNMMAPQFGGMGSPEEGPNNFRRDEDFWGRA